MKDSTTSEISNLFQELIVSKIKDEIELLKEEIDTVKETNETCMDKVEKLPKQSSVKQIIEEEQTKVIELINKIAKDSKSEIYLKDIVAYLKKQYSFSADRTLCVVLDEIQTESSQIFDEISSIKSYVDAKETEIKLDSLIEYIKSQYSFDEGDSLCTFLEQFSKKTEKSIASIITNQNSFVKKYDAIVKLLEEYRKGILTQIKSCTESLTQIKEKIEKNQQAIEKNGNCVSDIVALGNDSMQKINLIQESLNSIAQKSDNANRVISDVLKHIDAESDIYEMLKAINSSIENEEDSSDTKWSIKKNLVCIADRVDNLSKENEQQNEIIRSFCEKFDSLEKSKNKMIKILIAGDIITMIGVIGLILMQLL